MISLDEFMKLSTPEVAEIVRSNGSKVMVFPINGTQRWFMMEHGHEVHDDPISAYMDIVSKRHIELYKLIFDHGVDTLITPLVGPEILATRNAYMQKMGATGLSRVMTHPIFVDFYEEYDVRVHVYGEHRKFFKGTPYEHISDLFDGIYPRTREHSKHRLFMGAFADNLSSTSVIADFSIEYYKTHGKAPSQRDLVERYYGEYVEKANIFIGFDRLAVFDYPLINWGEEDLYFTVFPSLYLSQDHLRRILYDHLYTRRILERDFTTSSPEALKNIKAYYMERSNEIMGIGKVHEGIWVPE